MHPLRSQGHSSRWTPTHNRRRRIGAALLAVIALSPLASDREVSAQTISAEQIIASQTLPRFAPLSPDQAIDAFEVAPGYRIELVAAEPLVIDPVAFCFDDSGRMIVIEMRGYSERAQSQTGRVRRLTDLDHDGTMDQVETLVDGLEWPTAVACYRDGVVIGAAPGISYLPDRGTAQEAEFVPWFTGFGRSNVQGLLNSFRWGPDLRLHGATSSSGAELVGDTLNEPLRLGRQDFAIRLPERSIEPVAGGGQHGLAFDRWGDKFVCSNSDHLQQVVMVTPRAGRAARISAVPPLRRSIASDGPQATVYRASPAEPWRILRTHLRVSGQATGPIEGGGRASGYFTGATGLFIDLGDQWPRQDHQVALVCDVGGNLVHRKRLEPDGLWNRGVRIDRDGEFVRSSDTWFRPVQLGSGPDGAIYIADMYRELIEHPDSLPPRIKSQLDLNSGNERGRIWRVVADDRPLRRDHEPLSRLGSAALVEQLTHPNGWHRRTAARLILERNDPSMIAPLRTLVIAGKHPESRLEAFHVLATFEGGINWETIERALGDAHPRVRQQAVCLSADQADEFASLAGSNLHQLARDPSIHVRFQLAHDAVDLIPDRTTRAHVLAIIASADPADPWIRWAVEGSLGESAEQFLAVMGQQPAGDPVSSDWLAAVVCQLLETNNVDAIDRVFAGATRSTDKTQLPATIISVLASQLEGRQRTVTDAPLVGWIIDRIANPVSHRVANGDLRWPEDQDRLRLLAWASDDLALELLQRSLRPTAALRVQRAALETLVINDHDLVKWLLGSLDQLTPTLHVEALLALARTREGLKGIQQRIEARDLAMSSLPPPVVDSLRQSNAAANHAADQASIPAATLDVNAAPFLAVLGKSADVDRGRTTFVRHCAVCHQPPPGSSAVGPMLKSIVEKSPEQILWSILDPNREVDPKYFRTLVISVSGQVITGIVVEETEQGLTLVDGEGQRQTVSRADIEMLRTSTESLMPSEFAKLIEPAEMRDLIEFLRTSQ